MLIKHEWKRLCNKLLLNRSRRPEVFCKKGVLKNFAKFIGKHLRQGLRWLLLVKVLIDA